MMIFRSLQKVHKHDTHSTSGGSNKIRTMGLKLNKTATLLKQMDWEVRQAKLDPPFGY